MSGQSGPDPDATTAKRWRRFIGRGDEEIDVPRIAGEQERQILEALEDLHDMEVREVMTPRLDVVSLSIPVTADDVADAVRETGNSCFPVVHDDLDHLVGVLFVNDLFRAGWSGPTPRRARPRETPTAAAEDTAMSSFDISRRIRQPYLVPESRPVLDTLAEMRRQRRTFAVVVDEYGGIAGVITIKDLLEPLVGDLSDEFDSDDEPEMLLIDRQRWLIDGQTNVDDVREELGIDIPEGEYVTIAGFALSALEHVPEEGEQFTVGEWELRIAEMDKRRVAKIIAKSLAEPDGRGDMTDKKNVTPTTP